NGCATSIPDSCAICCSRSPRANEASTIQTPSRGSSTPPVVRSGSTSSGSSPRSRRGPARFSTALPFHMPASLRSLRNLGQELYELGPKGAAFRVVWEISRHGGSAGAGDLPPEVLAPHRTSADSWMSHLPFPDPISVADAVSDRIPSSALQHLLLTADRALP